MPRKSSEAATIEGAVQRLRPQLTTVCVVLASLVVIPWETGVGSDVMKPIAAPLVGRRDYVNDTLQANHLSARLDAPEHNR